MERTSQAAAIGAGALDLVVLWGSRHLSPFYLWGFWDLPEPLDGARLTAAVERLFRQVPVLGCRLKESFFRAVWEPLPGLDPATLVAFERFASEAEARAAVDRVVASPIGIEESPGFRLHQFAWDGGARLVLQLHHCLVDGFGFCNVMEALARCYARPDGPDRAAPLPTARGVGPLIAGLRLAQWLRMPFVYLREQYWNTPLGRRRARFRMDRDSRVTGVMGEARHHPVAIEPRTMGRLLGFCREKGCTFNDLLMTATLVAMNAWNRRERDDRGKRLPLGFASNLRRRYGKAAGPVANLSAPHLLWLPVDQISDLARTLPRVKAKLDGMKRRGLGLDALANVIMTSVWPVRIRRILIAPLMRLLSHYVLTMPALTNIGVIPDGAGAFGEGLTASRCSILASIFPVNSMLFTATTYRGRLTFQIGFDGRGLSPEAAERFGRLLCETLESSIE